MEKKGELKLAYTILVVLLVVGIGAYVAFPQRAPEQPVRILFQNIGGKVLFDHKQHFSSDGYGYGCKDCHHDIDKDDERPSACSECHLNEPGDAPKRSDALHKQCIECHKDSGSGPVDCSQCHVR
ncbi:MAG: cytochrome C [Deltaproteobacteria bacterium CG_4_8_14_3_um_filter_51_11]|nr:cytochrome c3 family protein [bacterium]OIP40841.1 MAG: cytochrome C [Desulfobacteraceae bacterium CG2_30_51_40]PIP47453.1 MAG: cytochrome C [Deltaproteobacteria bacterium CG23_combo_of_CG06-09_8_20_14_all_51_20]PIX18851.1 MAG: cytochrome C [Deltaproteobacteria bacterium CG_4_8_14_3_um_filter_51_11]PIY25723.1 MAG: cytochrome C [Deltaproteobacteria bacterium CG_4_10_14_3_um_filter_51_14]